MSLPRMNTDLNIIQTLDDRPNDTGGLTPAALKAKFDEAVTTFQNWMNNTFSSYLESYAGAGSIGVTTFDNYTDTDLQSLLESMAADITSAGVGNISSNSIYTAAIQNSAVTTAKIDDGAVTEAKLDTTTLDYETVNLAANQVRPIYVTNNTPTGADPDGIYLVY